MKEYNPMQVVKRRFFAMRNGVVADTLRRGGSKFRIIFGLNLPQIVEIARETGVNREMADALWNNRTTRESMLLAPMLIPDSDLTHELVFKMAKEIDDVEVADNFVHRVVRRMPDRSGVIDGLAASERAMDRYMALRAVYAEVATEFERAGTMARQEIRRADPLTLNLARMIVADADWYAAEPTE